MTLKKNERELARDALVLVFKERTPLSHHIAALPPFSRNLCFGVCRHAIQLETLALHLLKKKPKGLDVWISLLMGLYQIHHLKLPDYAVVQETVALLNTHKTRWARGLMNATLRHYCRDQAQIIAEIKTKPAFINNHPEWLIGRLKKAWPNDWESILQNNDIHPPMSIRVNTSKISTSAYLKELTKISKHGRLLEHAPGGISLSDPCDVYELPGFQEGLVSVQDEAAQLSVTLLDLKPNLRVLDACSAPGGKTGHILETEAHLKTCVALDVDARRLSRVQENLNRLNLQATLIQSDASDTKKWWDNVPFDRILLDAPCSATGVIRRHPDIKLLRTPEEITAINAIQKNLLESLWPCLAHNGILLYATCSVLPEENELQIAQFVSENPDCEVISKTLSWGINTGHGYQILPGENNMDGFFYSILLKK